jgi:hypothetical protein
VAPTGTRRVLLAVFLFGSAGNLAELLLLEHVDSAVQWLPLALLAAGTGAAAWLLLAGRRASPVAGPTALRVWHGLLALYVLAGPVGIFLHLKGNREFELELDAGLRGFALWRDTLMGATPALAPGAMTLLGVIGWLATRRGAASG